MFKRCAMFVYRARLARQERSRPSPIGCRVHACLCSTNHSSLMEPELTQVASVSSSRLKYCSQSQLFNCRRSIRQNWKECQGTNEVCCNSAPRPNFHTVYHGSCLVAASTCISVQIFSLVFITISSYLRISQSNCLTAQFTSPSGGPMFPSNAALRYEFRTRMSVHGSCCEYLLPAVVAAVVCSLNGDEHVCTTTDRGVINSIGYALRIRDGSFLGFGETNA
jgi:hypothetical protein